MKQTNYLNPTMFYQDFLDWLVRLEPFHSDNIQAPMTADNSCSLVTDCLVVTA